MNNKISAVVVTYNRKELLKECVNALLNQSYSNFDVLIIDNASTDGTEESIKEYLSEKVQYFNTGANLGGAGGFNFGIRKAVESGADYVWIMDDDCIPTETTLEKLVEFGKEKNDEFGYLSSVVKWKDGSICKMNIQKTNLSKRVEDFSKNQEIQLASFVSLFLRSAVVEELGLPIKEFFIWGDDWEYTSRIAKKYKNYLVAGSEVIHKSNVNIGVDISKDIAEKIPRYFYAYRNEGYFYSRLGFKGKLYNFIKRQLHRLRIFKSKDENKKAKYEIIKKGFNASKTFNPRIEYAFRPNRIVRVLECFAEPLSYGGQEAFMVNMYQNFKNRQIEYTFFTPFNCDNKTLIDLTEKRGHEIVAGNCDFSSKLRKYYIVKEFKKLVKERAFNVVHIQSGSVWALFQLAKIAKKAGVNQVIVHSHSTGNNTFFYRLIKKYSDKRIKKYADKFFACSKLAGDWKFPKDIMQEGRCLVVKNGIDVNKFKFNPETRGRYRKEFNIKDDELVLLNVGRFSEQKNHPFIVKIASKLKDKGLKFKFILVGDGELKEEIQTEIIAKGLNNKFIFLEKRFDVAEIMSASDIFVFPSLFEGLGIVAVEAQASGLQTICSTAIPEEVELTKLIDFKELENEKWIEKILNAKPVNNREEYAKIIAEKGFDSKISAQILEEEYLS